MKNLSEIPYEDGYVYLASPYSGTDFEQQLRYQHTLYATKLIFDESFAVFSPIVHCHELAHSYSLPKDSTFWGLYNSIMLRAASEVWILMLLGWEHSQGVANERTYAEQLGRPVRYLYFPPEMDRLLVMETEKA